jgi:hypothetical protein
MLWRDRYRGSTVADPCHRGCAADHKAASRSDQRCSGRAADTIDLSRLTHFGHRGSLWPTDQSGWNPAGLTTLRPTCTILGTEIPWLGVTAEQDAVIERVDIDRAPGAHRPQTIDSAVRSPKVYLCKTLGSLAAKVALAFGSENVRALCFRQNEH